MVENDTINLNFNTVFAVALMIFNVVFGLVFLVRSIDSLLQLAVFIIILSLAILIARKRVGWTLTKEKLIKKTILGRREVSLNEIRYINYRMTKFPSEQSSRYYMDVFTNNEKPMIMRIDTPVYGVDVTKKFIDSLVARVQNNPEIVIDKHFVDYKYKAESYID